MYISSCSIRSWNWNRKLTQDHFLIEHWIQRTQCCPAARCWPWVHSWVLVSRYSTVRSETLTWREWGLWSWPTTVPCKGRTTGGIGAPRMWWSSEWHGRCFVDSWSSGSYVAEVFIRSWLRHPSKVSSMWTLPQIVKIQNCTKCNAIRKSPSGSIIIGSWHASPRHEVATDVKQN